MRRTVVSCVLSYIEHRFTHSAHLLVIDNGEVVFNPATQWDGGDSIPNNGSAHVWLVVILMVIKRSRQVLSHETRRYYAFPLSLDTTAMNEVIALYHQAYCILSIVK